MNQYGLPLISASKQTIIPAMTTDGRVYGFYPITSTTYSSGATSGSVTLPEGTLTLTTVTLDSQPGRNVTQFMAAVFPIPAFNSKPWEGYASFVHGDSGYYRWFSLPTESWFLHFGLGTLLQSLEYGLASTSYSPPEETNPSVTDGAMTWQASINYAMLHGDYSFLDFNWMTIFEAKSNAIPLRIVVTSNPAGGALKASIIGVSTDTPYGQVFDSIRILKLSEVTPGTYDFGFKVYDIDGNSTDVTLVLTIQ